MNTSVLLRTALQNNDYATAIDCLEARVIEAQAAGDLAAEGRSLGNLALLYNRVQQPEEALRCFQRALVLVRAEDDQLSEDGILGNMGNILRELGRPDEALDYLNAALQLAQTIGDLRGRGIWLSNLGLVYDDLRQAGQAVQYHQQSVEVARQLHDQRGLATRLSKLSESLLADGQPLEALKCLGEALSIYTTIGDQTALREGLQRSAAIHVALGHQQTVSAGSAIFYSSALAYYQHALTLARTGGDTLAEADILNAMTALKLEGQR